MMCSFLFQYLWSVATVGDKNHGYPTGAVPMVKLFRHLYLACALERQSVNRPENLTNPDETKSGEGVKSDVLS